MLQPDGKIVVGGDSSDGSETQFALVRYDANGSLDSTFGSGGVVTTQVGAANGSVDSLAPRPDGKIVADGDSVDGSTVAVPGLVRYNADGSLDSTFGSGGIVTKPLFGSNGVTGGPLALQPDGKIVAAGTYAGIWVLARYNTDGSLDPTFGSNGTGTSVLGGGLTGRATSLVLEPDGKILVGGSNSDTTDFPDLLELARLNPDGTTDETFAGFGIAFLTTWTGSSDSPAPSPSPAVALKPDGEIVAVGSESADAGATQQFLLARFGASTLTVNLGDSSMGAGGEITSNPAGLDCSADFSCFYPGFFTWQRAFAAGTVTLTATPWKGWSFEGWSGGGCLGTGTCQVEMSGEVSDDLLVTASFTPDPTTLVVTKAGSGTGTVTSSPAGIHCGSECTDVFADGSMVTLTAHPSGDSRFSGLDGRWLRA